MYNKVFESLWPGRGLMPTVCKVLASNGVSDPLFFFPTFYTMREVPIPLRATPTRAPSAPGSGLWPFQGAQSRHQPARSYSCAHTVARAGGQYGVPVGRLCPQRAVQVQPELLEGLDQLVDDLVRTEKARPALRASPSMERGRENLRSQAAWVHGCLCHAAAPTDAVDR